jgi:hypothetical protein
VAGLICILEHFWALTRCFVGNSPLCREGKKTHRFVVGASEATPITINTRFLAGDDSAQEEWTSFFYFSEPNQRQQASNQTVGHEQRHRGQDLKADLQVPDAAGFKCLPACARLSQSQAC